MRGLGCATSATLMSRRASGLSASESLRLEEHLADCEACQQEADLLFELRALAKAVDPVLTVDARQRAFRGALRAQRAARTAPSRAPSWAFALSAAVAVATLVAIVWPNKSEEPKLVAEAAAGAKTTTFAAPSASVLEGSIELAGAEVARGGALRSGEVVRATSHARIAVGHAEVELQPATSVRWDAAKSELDLLEGTLTAEVDPLPKKPFAVTTEEFRADVLGTRFEITPEHVLVTHGRVRVTSRAGIELAMLRAGERYDHELPEVLPEHEHAEAEEPADARPQPRQPARRLLARARGELAQGQVGVARATLQSALRRKLTRTEHAEALTLRAECAAFAGQSDEAVKAYLAVARRFVDLPAGENALFAAARTEADRGRAQVAKQLLQRYVKSYPRGRFSAEVERRLQRLASSTTR